MYWIGGLFILTMVVPNITNYKEKKAFSDEIRLEEAKKLYQTDKLGDSITVVPGEFYERSRFAKLFLGQKNRDLWNIPVQVPVFTYEEAKGGLEPVEFGGGQQTISIELEDEQEREWALRSVNKDQKAALPKVLWPTFIRFLFRDAAAGLNPYGHLVIPVLSEAIGIHHKNPRLVFVPYNEEYGKYNQRMAGRLAYLEEHLNSSWEEAQRYGSPEDIVNTEEMMEMQQEKGPIPIDTALYLRTRLLDFLISDWDRHPGNWEWAYFEEEGPVFEPIAKDRDAAFYVYNDGLLSHIGSLFTNKFQSYRKEYKSVAGLIKQSKELDKRILSDVPLVKFIKTAREIQDELSGEVIEKAFRQYPPNVYEQVGVEHQEILKARLEKLPGAAARFFELLQEENKY